MLTKLLLRLVCFCELDPILLEMWGEHDWEGHKLCLWSQHGSSLEPRSPRASWFPVVGAELAFPGLTTWLPGKRQGV